MAYREDKRAVAKKPSLDAARSVSARPYLTVDYEAYAHLLDDPDLSEEQKRECLQTLWNFIVEVVLLGWGVHPVQQVQETCGKVEDFVLKPALTPADAVYLDHTLIDKFMNEATPETERPEEGVS